MIIEELVALVGIKVESHGELKKLERGLVDARRRILEFGQGLREIATDKLKSLASGAIEKISSGLRSGTSTLAVMARTMATVAIVAAGAATAVGLIALAAAKAAINFVRARAEAAKMRREARLDAAFKRTTPENIEKMQAGFRAINAPEDAAKEAATTIFEKSDAAILDPKGEEAKWFRGRKIPVMAKNGDQRDPMAMFDDVLRSYMDQKAKRDEARIASKADPKNVAKERLKNDLEVKFRKDQKNFPGIPQGLQNFLEGMKNYAELDRRRTEFNRANPSAPPNAERDKELAEGGAKLANTVEGIANAFKRPIEEAADNFALKLLGPLNEFADGISAKLKEWKLIPETVGDKRQRETARARDREGKALYEDTLPKQVERARDTAKASGDASILAAMLGSDRDRAVINLRTALADYDRVRGQHADAKGRNAAPQQLADLADALSEKAQYVVNALNALKAAEAANPPPKSKAATEDKSTPRGIRESKKPDQFRPSEHIEDRRDRARSSDVAVTELPGSEAASGWLKTIREGLTALGTFAAKANEVAGTMSEMNGAEAAGRTAEAFERAFGTITTGAQDAGQKMEGALNIKARPEVDTSSIDAAIGKAEQLKRTLDGASSAASAASARASSGLARMGASIVKGNSVGVAGASSP